MDFNLTVEQQQIREEIKKGLQGIPRCLLARNR